jgi:hypothetical protein
MLNESAAEIVRRLDGTRTIGEISGELAAATGRLPSEIEADVRRLLGALADRGLV